MSAAKSKAPDSINIEPRDGGFVALYLRKHVSLDCRSLRRDCSPRHLDGLVPESIQRSPAFGTVHESRWSLARRDLRLSVHSVANGLDDEPTRRFLSVSWRSREFPKRY